MAHLTYDVLSGSLTALPEKRNSAFHQITAFGVSGGSNFWWDSGRRQVGKHGTPGHVHGGPIPNGRWRVGIPGAAHPDGGQLRTAWIPIGPVHGRTLLYIHCGTRTEGCINIPVSQRDSFLQLVGLLQNEGGGWLTVWGGGAA